MGYSVGVWDATASSDAATRVSGSWNIGGGSSSTSVNRVINQTLTFTAQPNHAYYVFFTSQVNGMAQYGSSQANMQVGCGGGLEIQFPSD